MRSIKWLSTAILFSAVNFVLFADEKSIDSCVNRVPKNEFCFFSPCYFIGSSFFMLGNFIPDDPNPPDFVQLNFGYRITPKDVISIEAKTW
jgi:hypothetical protein